MIEGAVDFRRIRRSGPVRYTEQYVAALAPSPVLMDRVLSPKSVLELLKPVTWFAPMWAYLCGIVSAGVSLVDHWALALTGVVLAGPLVCGMSQAVNDWFDRHVDAINEPQRPIPSGRIPGRWGLAIGMVMSVLSLLVAWLLGLWVLVATAIAVVLAWIYSMPPLRLKQNGWWGNTAVGFSYEGIAWFTGAAAMLSALPSAQVISLAVLYSIGAHGIMTLNDFKSVEGDRRMGLASLPAQLGVERAVWVACLFMATAQFIVIALLLWWERPYHAIAVIALVTLQMILMSRLVEKPKERAPWYNATGTSLYVIGMLVSAFAVRDFIPG